MLHRYQVFVFFPAKTDLCLLKNDKSANFFIFLRINLVTLTRFAQFFTYLVKQLSLLGGNGRWPSTYNCYLLELLVILVVD